MSLDRREISPEELAAVFRLAATYPDLRVLEAELKELADLRKAVRAMGAGGIEAIAPKSVSDLLRLEAEHYLTHAQVAEKLGLIPENGNGVSKNGREDQPAGEAAVHASFWTRIRRNRASV